MSNTVLVDLKLADNLTGGIREAMSSARGATAGLTGEVRGLGSVIGGSVLKANLLTSAITTGVQAATSAIGGMVSAFKEASDVQISNLGLAGQFGALTNRGYGYALGLIKDLNAEFTQMAAALPGATQDYKDLGLSISDTLIQANQVNGVFDEKAFKAQAASITQSMGLIKATNKELLTQDVALFFSKFSMGASESQLQILKLNERMPGLMTQLTKYKTELYGAQADVSKLTLQQRVKLFDLATKSLVPKEMVRDMTKTADSTIESFKTGLFDVNVGIFGLLRDLGGGKTAMDSISTALISLIGEGGLLDSVGKLLKSLGIPPVDPMRALASGVDTLNGWIRQVSGFLSGVADGALGAGDLGALAGNLVNRAITGIQALFSPQVLSRLPGLVSQAISTAQTTIQGYIATVNWFELGTAFVSVLANLSDSIVSTIQAINWGQVIQTVGFIGIATTQALSGVLVGLGLRLGQRLTGLTSWLVQAGIDSVASLGRTIFNGITSLFSKVGDGIQDAISNIQLPSIPGLGGGPQSGYSGYLPAGSPIPNAAGGFNLSGLLGAVARESRFMPSGAQVMVANTSEAVLTRSQQGSLASKLGQAAQVIFSPQISVQGTPGMDVDALASQVMARIEASFADFQASYLS